MDVVPPVEIFQQICESSPLGLVVFERTGKMAYLNANMIELLKVPSPRVPQLCAEGFQNDRLQAAITLCFSGVKGTFEGTISTIYGEGVPYLKGILSPIAENGRDISLVAGIFEDITLAHQKERELTDRVE